MPAEDEPFEFFRGFSEIFISIGLVILLSGITALLAPFGGFALLYARPADLRRRSPGGGRATSR